ncbi:MAG: response regulator [Planctomycetaceae bacterium]|nr:response regulator [Planctomycetaceae bacterium]
MSNILKLIPIRIRISIGLVGLMTGTILLASAIGFLPNPQSELLRGRAKLCEAMAISGTAMASSRNPEALDLMLESIVNRDTEVQSIGMRLESGDLLTFSGPHIEQWDPSSTDSTIQMSVPIYRFGEPYAELEVAFSPIGGLLGLNYWSPAWLLVLMIPACLIQFSVFLRKTLESLDPTSAVPQHVQGALDSLSVGLLLIDSRGRVLFANRLFVETVKLKPGKLIGQHASRMPWTRAESIDLFPWQESAQSNEIVTGRILHYPCGDRRLTFSVNCTPILQQGYMVTFEDITLLEENKVELAKARDEAQLANESKSNFLANMSHEIRTPMNAILGFTEVLRRNIESDESKRRHHLNTIHSSGTHLLGLINDILDLSKVEADRLEVESISCSVPEVIADVANVMRVKAEEKGITLDYCFENPLPTEIESDPGRIRQILTNLVGNAVKFTTEGGVRIVTDFQESRTGSKLLIHVVDTGIGMSESAAAKIFDPFSQADASVTRRFGGTGLGLSISKRFAEALGGSVSVTSEEGVGSVFTVQLNLGHVKDIPRIMPTRESLESNRKHSEHLSISLPDLRVLVVDDGKENRDLIGVLLEEAGATFATAENGEEAIALANASHWDVILMDVQMPVLDGNSATRQLRKQGYSKPIYALTAHAMQKALEESIDAGCDGVLTKPLDFDLLIQTLAKIAGVDVTQTHPKRAQLSSNTPPPSTTPMHTDDQPIYSTLPMSKAKFRDIVTRFVECLDERFEQMEQTIDREDFEELADLGHWLKGASGNCGFSQMSAAGMKLEETARNHDRSASTQTLHELREMKNRIVVQEPDFEATGV